MNGRASHAEEIASECLQLGLFKQRTNVVREQMLHAILTIVARCGDGRQFAYGYNYGRVEERELKEAFEFAQDLPPTTCERFQKINPEGCEGCPHKGKITSPIQLGRQNYAYQSEVNQTSEESIQASEQGPARLLDRFGWHGDSFLCGHRLYSARGVEQVELADDIDIKAIRLGPGTGSLAGWTGAANKLFAAGFEPMSFGLLCSFAAPLMRFYDLGKSGAIVSTYSSQSKGSRTLALNAAASVWGHPEGTRLADEGFENPYFGNLPLTYEDFAKRDPETCRRFVASFTERGGTILLLSSARPLSEFLGSESDYVLEFRSSFPRGHFYQNDMELIEHELFANAGWAGDSYLRYLVQPAVLEHVKNVLPLREQQIRDELAAEKHRFWARPIAACIVGGTIVRHLGLADFSLQRIVKWVIDYTQR